jgi:hypothetical protein
MRNHLSVGNSGGGKGLFPLLRNSKNLFIIVHALRVISVVIGPEMWVRSPCLGATGARSNHAA